MCGIRFLSLLVLKNVFTTLKRHNLCKNITVLDEIVSRRFFWTKFYRK